MKATGKFGALCLLITCTYVQAQQTTTLVLSADASIESSSNPHLVTESAASTQSRTLIIPTALQQVSDGNAWMRSSALHDPAVANSDDCIQLASLSSANADLDEIPGGGLALRNFSLHGEFTRDHMIAMARNFVPSKPLPDAPSSKALTSKEKFEGWAHHTYSADMLLGTVFDTLILQATGAYRDYGGGMRGFMLRR